MILPSLRPTSTLPLSPTGGRRTRLRHRTLTVTAVAATAALLTLSGTTAGVAASAKAQPNKPGTNTTASTTASPAAQTCVTPPDAAALAARFGEWGGDIHTLYNHHGQVFYGYGNYGVNTGSASTPYGTNVSSFDPVTGAFTTHLSGFKTEEVNTFRTIDGALYTPAIDPSAGADWTNSFASNRDGVWAENDGAPATEHVFDVAGAGGDLLVSGSWQTWGGDVDNYRASVWLSTDGGRTWAESMSDTPADPADRDWYERYYWMGTIGTKVYTRAAMNAPLAQRPLRVFDTRTDTWSTVADKRRAPAFGDGIYRANQVVSWGGRLWSANYASLLSFDGTTTTAITAPGTKTWLGARVVTVGDDGLLYVYTNSGQVYRVTAPTKGGKAPTLVPLMQLPAGAAAFTVAAKKAWISVNSGAAEVCGYPLPQ